MLFLPNQYKPALTFAGLLESGGVPSSEVGCGETSNLANDDGKPKMDAQQNTVHDNKPPPKLPEDEELNDIRAELFGGKVRIRALMDKDGLEQLEKKIAAFKTLLS